MTDLRKAAEIAATDLEELIHWHGVRNSDDKLMPAHNQTPEIKSAIESLEALRQALAQPEQEPFGYFNGHYVDITPQRKLWLDETKDEEWKEFHYKHRFDTPLYTAPPKREWVGLTDEEVEDLYFDNFSMGKLKEFAQAIEAKLKEKNT